MTQDVRQPTLDTRAYALAFWADPAREVDPTRLPGAQRREVETMAAAGWLDGPPGAYVLNETGREAIGALMPEKLPKLTAAQEELLCEVLSKPKGLGFDITFTPGRRLLAYGVLEVKPQRYGGLWFTANARAHAWNGSTPPGAEPEPAPEASAGPRP